MKTFFRREGDQLFEVRSNTFLIQIDGEILFLKVNMVKQNCFLRQVNEITKQRLKEAGGGCIMCILPGSITVDNHG